MTAGVETLSERTAECPNCGRVCTRHSVRSKLLQDIGHTATATIKLVFSVHFCATCHRHFIPANVRELAPLASHYTSRVRDRAMSLYMSGLTLDQVSAEMQERYFVRVPPTTLHGWLKK